LKQGGTGGGKRGRVVVVVVCCVFCGGFVFVSFRGACFRFKCCPKNNNNG
jgi:hypothetical protein